MHCDKCGAPTLDGFCWECRNGENTAAADLLPTPKQLAASWRPTPLQVAQLGYLESAAAWKVRNEALATNLDIDLWLGPECEPLFSPN